MYINISPTFFFFLTFSLTHILSISLSINRSAMIISSLISIFYIFFTPHPSFLPFFFSKRLDQVWIRPPDTINNKYHKGQIRQQEQEQQQKLTKRHHRENYNNNDKSKRPVGRDWALLVRFVELYTLLQRISSLSWLPWKHQEIRPPCSHHVNFVGQNKKKEKNRKKRTKKRKKRK